LPDAGVAYEATYSTGKPICSTTGAAADSVMNKDSVPSPSRRAIAIDRVRCPSPVPLDVVKRTRKGGKALFRWANRSIPASDAT
jgi:hypothetical protein